MTQVSMVADADVAVVSLHNPPQNRLSPQMLEDLAAVMEQVERSDIRAVLLRADGDDFSYGGDIEPWPAMSQRERRSLFESYLATCNRFERLPVPTVSAVQGLCFGGGLELALRADVVIAGESARFGHPEQSIAIVTLLGGIHRVAERAGRSKAIEWAFTSEQVPSAEMERHGVVNRVVPDLRLDEEALAFTRRLAAGPTRAHAAHKAILRAWVNGGTAAADELLMDLAMNLFESEDAKSAIPAAVQALRSAQPRPRFDFKGV